MTNTVRNAVASATGWGDLGNEVNRSHSEGFCAGMAIGVALCSKIRNAAGGQAGEH